MAMADDLDDGLAAYNDGDYATALKLWKPLAEQGDAEAQYNLGQMYQYGEGVRKDAKEAARWYRMAANKHHTKAQYALGLMYANGKGVIADDKKTHIWLNIAPAYGDDSTDHIIEILTQRMTPADISEAQEMARQCLASNYQDC